MELHVEHLPVTGIWDNEIDKLIDHSDLETLGFLTFFMRHQDKHDQQIRVEVGTLLDNACEKFGISRKKANKLLNTLLDLKIFTRRNKGA